MSPEQRRLEEVYFNRMSRAGRRFMAMGFEPKRQSMEYDDHLHGYRCRFSWMCFCGRYEMFQRVISEYEVQYILAKGHSVFAELERAQATTRQHLEADGFAPEVIDEIMRRAEAFDRKEAPPERGKGVEASGGEPRGQPGVWPTRRMYHENPVD